MAGRPKGATLKESRSTTVDGRPRKEACCLRFKGRRAALLSLGSLALTPLVRSCPSPARARTLGGWVVPARSEAMDIARAVVDGTCGVLVHVDRLRHLPPAKRLLTLGQWGAALDKLSIDPLEEVRRVFVTSPRIDETARSATVIELGFEDPDRIRLALEAAATRTEDGSVLSIDGTRFLVEAPSASALVIVPEPHGDSLTAHKRLLRAGACLPEPTDDEVLYGFAEKPSETLGDTLPWPDSIRDVHSRLALSPWGATLDVVATSSSEEQAKKDAETLTAALESRLRVDLVVFQWNILPRGEFEARGDRVELSAQLGRTEVEILLALGSL
jgi:hypothetical protein